MAGGLKKRSFGWFNKMGLSNSYRTALRRNGELAKDHDSTVIQWKEAHETEFKKMKTDGLDYYDKDDLKNFRETNPQPPNYQVINYFNVLKIRSKSIFTTKKVYLVRLCYIVANISMYLLGRYEYKIQISQYVNNVFLYINTRISAIT